MSALSLRKNFSWTLASNIVYGIYQWSLIAIIAKVLGPASVGQFAVALALVTPVQMFCNLQLRALQASDPDRTFAFADYFTTRILTSIFAIIVVVALSLLWDTSLAGRLAIWGILVIKSIESISDVIYGAFQQAERMDISSKSRILESAFGIVLFANVFYCTRSLILGLLAIVAALTLVLIFYTVPRMRRVLVPDVRERRFWHLDISILRKLFLLAFPLGITMGILNINTALPRLALDRFAGDFEVGIFAGQMQLVVAGTIVIAALGQAVTPTLARYITRQDTVRFYSLVNRLAVIALLIGGGGALIALLAGETILKFLYTSDYAEYKSSLVILAVSGAFTFLASFQGYALTAARVIAAQVWMLFAVVLVTIGALVVLVPLYGLNGASISVLLGALTQGLVSWTLLRMRVRINP